MEKLISAALETKNLISAAALIRGNTVTMARALNLFWHFVYYTMNQDFRVLITMLLLTTYYNVLLKR